MFIPYNAVLQLWVIFSIIIRKRPIFSGCLTVIIISLSTAATNKDYCSVACSCSMYQPAVLFLRTLHSTPRPTKHFVATEQAQSSLGWEGESKGFCYFCKTRFPHCAGTPSLFLSSLFWLPPC